MARVTRTRTRPIGCRAARLLQGCGRRRVRARQPGRAEAPVLRGRRRRAGSGRRAARTDLSASREDAGHLQLAGLHRPARRTPSIDAARSSRSSTGITVDYTDDVNDNSEFFAKVSNQLGACQPIGRDIMMLTDWMAARMIDLGWMQTLDPAKIPNLHANLIKPLRNRQLGPRTATTTRRGRAG